MSESHGETKQSSQLCRFRFYDTWVLAWCDSFLRTSQWCGAFQNSVVSTYSLILLTPLPSWEVNRESIAILLPCTRKLRYLRDKGHDWGCTLAGGGVKTLTRNSVFFHFITFDRFQSILIPLCLLGFVWYFSARVKWGTPRWMSDPCFFWFLWKDTTFPDWKFQQELLFLGCSVSTLSLLTFPSSLPEVMLTQRTFEPPLEAWSKMDWQTLFGFRLLKIEC